MSLHDSDDEGVQYVHDYERRNSIDLTLELERQLDMESLPTSPADPRFAISPQSLDPSVLASLVTQLRLSLIEVEKERDELVVKLSEANARESGLKDALDGVTEKCIHLEGELAAVVEKSKDDQDAVVMLRGKLEDSRCVANLSSWVQHYLTVHCRRALMRLQTENRRASQISNMTLDLSRAGPSSLNGPPSSRRSSFIPLTGSPGSGGHRRIVSVSEPGTYQRGSLSLASPPRSGQLETLQLVDGSSSTSNGNSRRISGFFGRGTSPTPDLPIPADASEVEQMRKELATIKDQLEETRHELTEAREAQEASETCVRALRTFISENSIGMQPPGGRPAQSAPPTTAASTSEPMPRTSTSSGRWGFKLWNTPANASSTPSSSPALSSASAPAAASAPPPPIGRKLTGFFSSRGSISSTSSVIRPEPHSHQQEPMFNGSDSSSVDSGTEPISPSSEIPPASIMVHNENSSSFPMTESPEHHTKDLGPVDVVSRLDGASLE